MIPEIRIKEAHAIRVAKVINLGKVTATRMKVSTVLEASYRSYVTINDLSF